MFNVPAFVFVPIFFFLGLSARAAEPVVDWDEEHAKTLLHYESIVRISNTNPPGNETSVGNYLRNVLDREGIGYQVFALDLNRANLVLRLKGNGCKKPVLMVGHTDTGGVRPEVWVITLRWPARQRTNSLRSRGAVTSWNMRP